MPAIFKIGAYRIYFWSNENDPTEPVHVHICEGAPAPNATKIWITSSGKALLCNNNSRISEKNLRDIMRFIEANSMTIIKKWIEHFEGIQYFC